jgi:hypothetical protein
MSPPIVAPAAVAKESARPARVFWALVGLSAAWAMSAVALLVNQFLFHGSGIGPGLALGVLSLVFQAGTFTYVARGHFLARAVTVVFLLLAALPLQMLAHLIMQRSNWSAFYIIANFALKAVAVSLLFTRKANAWFANQRLSPREPANPKEDMTDTPAPAPGHPRPTQSIRRP